MTTEELLETFSLLESWEERYRFIIELGDELPSIPESEKTETNRIHGCQSQVWLREHVSEEMPPRIDFVADSDSDIVRGLLEIVRTAYGGKTPRQILDFDIEQFFDEFELRQHISARRGNGLREVVKRCQELAKNYQLS